MTSKLFAVLLVGLLLLATGAIAADEGPWFDMKNCGFCVSLMEDPNLMANMTWEHHIITNGMVTVTTIKREYMDSYKKAMAAMQATAAKMEKGEQVKMCNFCKAHGELMKAGIVMDYIPTLHGDVMIMTSDKPELVEKIKKFAQRTIDELKKMEAEEAPVEQE